MIFVGNDWAEGHHDVCVMNSAGERLAECRFDEGIDGVAGFHDLMARYVTDPSDVAVGVETDRGVWVEMLVVAGYQVYGVNPRSVSRYRDRHSVSGAKSDRGDAKVLADMVRTDRHIHRQVAGDTDLAHEINIFARTHQTLIWDRQRHRNRLRAGLRDYYPQALETFDDCASRDAVAVLGIAPTPQAATALSVPKIVTALKRSGPERYLNVTAEKIQDGLRTQHLYASGGVTAGFATATSVTVAILEVLNTQIAELETKLAPRFREHPDAAIYLSMPGCGVTLGARMLGEFGDEPERYTDPKARKNYAGTSPVTIASGKRRTVKARWIRNNHLHNAVTQWARLSIRNSDGARAFYDEQRAKGAGYHQAIRALGNRLVGCLHGCLEHRTLYNEDIAWAHRKPTETDKAA